MVAAIPAVSVSPNSAVLKELIVFILVFGSVFCAPNITHGGGHSVIGPVGLGVRIDKKKSTLPTPFVNLTAESISNSANPPRNFLRRTNSSQKIAAAMSTFAQPTNRGRLFVAACVSVAFLWALALSVSPQLHQRVHPDANRVEHNCAATIIASGTYDHAGHVP